MITEININNDGHTAEGYVVSTTAEQIDHWLEYRHSIFDDITKNDIRRYSTIAFLNNINVDESERGQGYGNALFGQFSGAANDAGAQAIFLIADIHEDQCSGFDLIAWYESFGFTTIINTSGGPLMLLELNS